MHDATDTGFARGSSGHDTTPMGGRSALRGRRSDCEALARLIEAARSGTSSAIVVRGEPGIGKSALLEHLLRDVSGLRVLRVSGIESEMELAYAGLHQLCGSLLEGIHSLPAPQAAALGTAFGLRPGRPPDRLLMGLSVLTLLSEAARHQPVLCLVDDAQWLDQASIQTLTFVARRLHAESVVLIFAARASAADQSLARLPELLIEGLGRTDAAALLESASSGPLDERVRDRILAETRGNPLALMELPRWFTTTELAFGVEPGRSRTLTSRMEEGFRRQLATLPEQTQRLLLIASADPLGDAGLLWRAAALCEIPEEAVVPA